MSKDAFRSREIALENEFFHQVDKKLLANLKAQLDADTMHRQLAQATGFDDDHLLDELVELGVSVEAITAVSLIPLVLVAWADKQLDALERSAVLRIASEQGVAPDSPAGQLLSHWLDTKPTAELLETWTHYVQALSRQMTVKARELLSADVLRRAREVAKVSGGPLGTGVITSDERALISELEKVLKS